MHQAFQEAGFDTAISGDILREMWEKWVWLSSVGAITCLLRGNIGEIAAVAGGAELSLAVLHECAAIAGACGYPMSEAFLAEKSPQLTAPGSALTSSMYHDLKDQVCVEVDTILGDSCSKPCSTGVVTKSLRRRRIEVGPDKHPQVRRFTLTCGVYGD